MSNQDSPLTCAPTPEARPSHSACSTIGRSSRVIPWSPAPSRTPLFRPPGSARVCPRASHPLTSTTTSCKCLCRCRHLHHHAGHTSISSQFYRRHHHHRLSALFITAITIAWSLLHSSFTCAVLFIFLSDCVNASFLECPQLCSVICI